MQAIGAGRKNARPGCRPQRAAEAFCERLRATHDRASAMSASSTAARGAGWSARAERRHAHDPARTGLGRCGPEWRGKEYAVFYDPGASCDRRTARSSLLATAPRRYLRKSGAPAISPSGSSCRANGASGPALRALAELEGVPEAEARTASQLEKFGLAEHAEKEVRALSARTPPASRPRPGHPGRARPGCAR